MPFIWRTADNDGLTARWGRGGIQQGIQSADGESGCKMFLLDTRPIVVPKLADLRHTSLDDFSADRFDREHGKCLVQDLLCAQLIESQTGFHPVSTQRIQSCIGCREASKIC